MSTGEGIPQSDLFEAPRPAAPPGDASLVNDLKAEVRRLELLANGWEVAARLTMMEWSEQAYFVEGPDVALTRPQLHERFQRALDAANGRRDALLAKRPVE